MALIAAHLNAKIVLMVFPKVTLRTPLTCLLIQYVFAYCTFQNHWMEAGLDG